MKKIPTIVFYEAPPASIADLIPFPFVVPRPHYIPGIEAAAAWPHYEAGVAYDLLGVQNAEDGDTPETFARRYIAGMRAMVERFEGMGDDAPSLLLLDHSKWEHRLHPVAWTAISELGNLTAGRTRIISYSSYTSSIHAYRMPMPEVKPGQTNLWLLAPGQPGPSGSPGAWDTFHAGLALLDLIPEPDYPVVWMQTSPPPHVWRGIVDAICDRLDIRRPEWSTAMSNHFTELIAAIDGMTNGDGNFADILRALENYPREPNSPPRSEPKPKEKPQPEPEQKPQAGRNDRAKRDEGAAG